jgi:hypothetical protein
MGMQSELEAPVLPAATGSRFAAAAVLVVAADMRILLSTKWAY